MTTMRDASFKDMAALWISRLMEKADWAPDSDIYLALIGHAAQKYIESSAQSHDLLRHIAELEELLNEILASLPEQAKDGAIPVRPVTWFMPTGIYISQIAPDAFKQHYAYYWSTNQWKSNFLSALENQFWTYKDYAHAAEKGKMAFLREFAEVWIAAATTALVRYGKQDKRGWRATANMLRRHADMIEADGLRALPWGEWGHIRDRPPED